MSKGQQPVSLNSIRKNDYSGFNGSSFCWHRFHQESSLVRCVEWLRRFFCAPRIFAEIKTAPCCKFPRKRLLNFSLSDPPKKQKKTWKCQKMIQVLSILFQTTEITKAIRCLTMGRCQVLNRHHSEESFSFVLSLLGINWFSSFELNPYGNPFWNNRHCQYFLSK